MVRVVKDQIIRELSRIDSPTVANAVEKLKIRSPLEGYLGADIKCMFPQFGRMVGYAFTVEIDVTSDVERDTEGELAEMYEQLYESKKPAIVVCKDVSPNKLKAAVWGGIMSTLAKRFGAVGLVTDGGVRDLADAKRLRFHYFAPSAIVAHGYNVKVVSIGKEVKISDVLIKPKDLVHGDENGVVVFPADKAEDVIKNAKGILKEESKFMRQAIKRTFTVEKLKRLWAKK
jgi:regulator of RNase E activity RraA